VTSRTGTVTTASCSTGEPVRSGDVLARIDGQPVVALASDEPLWRDLGLRDRGDDVSGLQRELTRLGAGLSIDGVLGPGTLRAAQQFLVDRGIDRDDLPDDVVPREPFAWVPSAENAVLACVAVVGAEVGDGVLVELPAELRGARIEALPVDPAPGERVLRIGNADVPIDAAGVVSSPTALAAIAALPEYAATVVAADGTPTVAATWTLRRPRTVQVVPPTALWDLDGDRACLQPTTGRPLQVEVLGSELGQSFVRVPGGRTLDRIRSTPDGDGSCR
jgi:peptidoglycan hydrolase-like protein with peptidoglycan-binding domain